MVVLGYDNLASIFLTDTTWNQQNTYRNLKIYWTSATLWHRPFESLVL